MTREEHDNEPSSDWKGRKLVELDFAVQQLKSNDMDKETRLRRLERGYFMALGIVLIANIILKFIKWPIS